MRRIWKEKKGFTLVELVVSFALLSILLTAAVATVSPAAKIFEHTISQGRAQAVSDLLLNKMTNELGAATEIIAVTADTVTYMDGGGNYVEMKITAPNQPESQGQINGLHLQYESPAEGEKGTDWFFADKVYMRNTIEELKFSTVADHEDLLEIRLKLKNTQNGTTQERTKVIACYASES